MLTRPEIWSLRPATIWHLSDTSRPTCPLNRQRLGAGYGNRSRFSWLAAMGTPYIPTPLGAERGSPTRLFCLEGRCLEALGQPRMMKFGPEWQVAVQVGISRFVLLWASKRPTRNLSDPACRPRAVRGAMHFFRTHQTTDRRRRFRPAGVAQCLLQKIGSGHGYRTHHARRLMRPRSHQGCPHQSSRFCCQRTLVGKPGVEPSPHAPKAWMLPSHPIPMA